MKSMMRTKPFLLTVLTLIMIVTVTTIELLYPRHVRPAVSAIKRRITGDAPQSTVRSTYDSNEATGHDGKEQSDFENLLKLPDDEFMKIQAAIQEARKQHLRKMCHKYHLNVSDPVAIARKMKEFLVDDKHKIVMCVTAKIAGKSWKKVLNVLAGFANNVSEQVDGVRAVVQARKIRRLSSYSTHVRKKSRISFGSNYALFMFSRHPLSRTLSAFNNLLSPNATERKKNQWGVGYQIVQQYRPMAQSVSETKRKYDLSFPEYVRFLIDQTMSRSRADNHHIENYKFCHPCVIPYTVIGRYETLLQDAKYILKLKKLDHKVSFPETEGPKATSTHSSNFQKMVSFYEQVPIGDLQKLIKRYELDYEFNYTLPTESGRNKWLGF